MKDRIENLKKTVLSDKTYILEEYTFDYEPKNRKEKESVLREVYDHGDGASVLLYNPIQDTVVLTKQFRLPAYLNGTEDGFVIEVCAGSLDGDPPEFCAKKEALEETGYKLDYVNHVMSVYASPAVVTEIAHLFIAEYNETMKVEDGGGAEEEHEDIEVLEFPFEKAYDMIASGEINDARTVMLLQHLKIKKLNDVL